MILLVPAVIYQGYCDAKNVKNKLAVLTGHDNSDIIIAIAVWPITIIVFAAYLIALMLGFPFWFLYNFSKSYFSK